MISASRPIDFVRVFLPVTKMEKHSNVCAVSPSSPMSRNDITIISETPDYQDIIETMNSEAFGPARFTRAAHLIREEGGHDMALSFIALIDSKLVGTIRMTPITVGKVDAYLLGPIVVSPKFRSLGLGSLLMNHTIEQTRKAGVPFILLAGDEPYYRRFGFSKVSAADFVMPRPVNPERLLALELVDGTIAGVKGLVCHKSQAKRRG